VRIHRGFIGSFRERLLTVRFLVPALLILLVVVAAGSVFITKNRVFAAPCPCNVFTVTPTPSTFSESTGIELGFKFRSNIDGYISGIRFFKTSNMGGTHVASLWNNQGQRITQATFGTETATGWQEVNFTPVAITANTIYTASVFMANGQYNASGNGFANDITNENLTAPRNGTAYDALGNGSQGVFNASGSSLYPTSSFNATNYWIDVSFVGSVNNDPPEVTAVAPAASATDVNLGDTVSAIFDRAMNAPSISASTFSLKDSSDNPVPGTVSYDTNTKKASLVVDGGFIPGQTYTATLEGGTGTTIQSLGGVSLAEDYVWSFTASEDDACPCTLKNGVNPAGAQTFDETLAGVEVGVKVVPEGNGYIQSLRFYKPILSDQTTHTGNIWDKNGTKLATVTFTNESEYGWQEAKLSTPLRVYEGQPYILSYGSTGAIYVTSIGAMNTTISSNGLTAYATGDARNAATGSGNGNGVFNTTIGNYPSGASSNASYYWIDAVFTNEMNHELAPEVTVSQPTNGSYGVPRSVNPSVTFNRIIDAGTVNSSSVQLLQNGSPVAGTPSYNQQKRSIVFTPASPLDYDQAYTLRLASSIADLSGAELDEQYDVVFTVGSEHAASLTNGLGGPVLVVTSAADLYGQYYSEILRTEGITYFDVSDISQLSSSLLSDYKAVVVAEMSLTQEQVDTISSWVNGGGNLIAMRPDKKLAGLLGLTDANSTRTNQYLKLDTATTPGAGITSDSMQFKGVGDNYTLSGAVSVADFYSNASTATSNPAVSYREVGSKGGTAAAFTYDLAKSVIAQHQGNRAWAGDDRDGSAPTRTNDLFYGAKIGDNQSDWTDMNKLHIPQADEQQRLLVNVMTKAMKDTTPMPRFWYLPGDNRAAVVMAGDDHGLPNAYGTQPVMNDWLNESPSNCSIEDWECVRASHYIYADSALTNDRAVQYDSYNFEIGVHPLEACGTLSYGVLEAQYNADLDEWRDKYTGLPDAYTSRVHCYAWSGWDFTTRYENTHGIKYDLNYVAYPAAWINGRSPILTGSGMNMRLTLDDGSTANVRQGVTNFDNTSASQGAINALLDNAIGASGYYGIFGTHYDMSDSFDNTLFAAAKARNIPMITAEQAVDWLEGRENSQFADLASASTGKVTFTIKAGEQADGLRALMPMEDKGGTLSSLKKSGVTVSYQTQTMKGISYAVFNAVPGEYEVMYSDYAEPEEPGEEEPGGESPNQGGSQSGENSSAGSSGAASSRGGGRGLLSDERTEDSSTEEPTSPSGASDSTNNEDGEGIQDETNRQDQKVDDEAPINWLAVIGVPVLAITILGGVVLWWRHNNAV